ncbi:MAG: UDP-N-acetylmuramoyl-tripeptide--D-alanyl-D-alanine ligase [Clostridia bacterium]
MRDFTGADILFATGGTCIAGDIQTVFSNIGTDSRKIEKDSLFVPIIGDNFDAHNFLKDALGAGAAGALISNAAAAEELNMPDKVIILVEDTLCAFGEMAKWYRHTFDVPVVAITGSVGKTSTKDMIHAVMNKKFSTLKNIGNFNNAVGLPLSVFRMESEYNAMVLEMGMNHLGEISWLSNIAAPDVAVITNVGISHIENLGSKQNILKAKLEIMDGMGPEGVLIINSDDAMLAGVKDFVGRRVVTFGTEEGADIRAEGVFGKGEEGCVFTLSMHGELYDVTLKVPGAHNVYNALAAIATGSVLGIPVGDMIEALHDFTSDDAMRMFICDANGVKIINDCYNASPSSMKAAFNVLHELNVSGRKFAVLGNILELGDWTEQAHREVGASAVQSEIDFLVTVGDFGNYTVSGALEAGFAPANIRCFTHHTEAQEFLAQTLRPGDAVLIKGSRGAKMEQIFQFLTQQKGGQ